MSTSHKLALLGGVVALIALVSIALRGPSAPKPKSEPPPGTAVSPDGHEHEIPSVDFKLNDLSGKAVDFAEARKGRVVLLKFGALWCGWCNKQAEEFVKLQQKLDPKKAIIFEVSVKTDLPAEKVLAKAQGQGLKHTIVRDGEGAVSSRFGIESLPSLFIISREGRVVWRGAYTTADKLESLLKKAYEEGQT